MKCNVALHSALEHQKLLSGLEGGDHADLGSSGTYGYLG